MSENENFKLKPKEYNAQLALIDLDQILLNGSSVKVKRENFDSLAETKIGIKNKWKYDTEALDEKSVTVYQSYDLTCYKKLKRDFAFKIKCEFEVVILQSQPLSEDFWEIYSNMNLRVNTWPYFREFVQNMTQRINVPPLTLPFSKV